MQNKCYPVETWRPILLTSIAKFDRQVIFHSLLKEQSTNQRNDRSDRMTRNRRSLLLQKPFLRRLSMLITIPRKSELFNINLLFVYFTNIPSSFLSPTKYTLRVTFEISCVIKCIMTYV